MSKLSEVYGGDLGEKPTISEAFRNNATKTPGALALVCTHQPLGLFGIPNIDFDDYTYRQRPYLRWSYQDLHHGIARLVAAWQVHGVQEGSVVVTFAGNGAEYVLTAYAAISMGCKFMPISARNLTNREELAHMVKTGMSIATGAKVVILAGNEQLAEKIDELAIFPADALKISVTEPGQRLVSTSSTWVLFEELMHRKPLAHGNGQAEEAGNHDASLASAVVDMSASPHGGTITFTSGTTNLPKGVFHPFQKDFARVWPYQNEAQAKQRIVPGSRFGCGLPNNHAMGWLGMTWPLTLGAALIIPSLAFDPAAVLEAFLREKVTHMVLVPTMVHALVAAKSASPEYASRPLSDIKTVFMGGSSLAPETLRLVIRDLGAQGGVHFWGCTEGLLSRSVWASAVSDIEDSGELSVGWPIPGYTFKIVDPETGDVLPRNVLGEIEGSGPAIVNPYIGGAGQDSWYRDEAGVLWFKTGDQGRIDEQGRLFISGRYKDMIIRGGENISPTAVEAVLLQNPLLQNLIPQVVAAKDAIAGEVPVAIIRGKVTAEIRDAVQKEIVQHMGTLYVPEDVLSTEDLGLTDYPRTTSGKIQKTKLAALANQYLSTSVGGGDKTLASEDLTEQVKTIWAKAVGLEPSHVRLDAPISEFADSITVMRVRDRIKRQTGRVLSLADMTATGTIGKQLEVLRGMSADSTEARGAARPRQPIRREPPTAEDMAHLIGDPELLEPTKKVVLETISPFGLGWEDVEDVVPAYDFNALMSQSRLYDSWRINFAVQPRSRVSKAQLRAALEAVICNNRILASFAVWDKEALGSDHVLHVIVKQSSKFFDLIVEDGGELETMEELGNLAKKHPDPSQVDCTGPLFRVDLYNVKEIDGAGMVVSMNHAIIDASSTQIITDDLDRALAGVGRSGEASASALLSGLEPHVDYKVWADSYYNLRTSIEARAATKWHVKRLKTLAEHVKTGVLFPAAPRSGEAAGSRRGEEPVTVSIDVPGLEGLRKEFPQITPTVVVKAAVALANVFRTGHSHAAFGNLEAARTYFPFVPRAMLEQASGGGHGFEATDVAGPTYTMVFNLVEVNKGGRETVVQFLQRMQDEQTLLTKYASAPLGDMMKGLDDVSPGAGALLPRLMDTQHFNWRPGLGTTGTDPYQHLRMLEMTVRPTTGLVWHAGLGGPRSQTLFMLVYSDGARVTRDDAASMGDVAVAVTKWLTTRENWARPVADFKTFLSHGC